MKHLRTSLILISSLCLVALVQNCSKPDINLAEVPAPAPKPEGGVQQPSSVPSEEMHLPSPAETLANNCRDARARGKTQIVRQQVLFEEPSSTCDWEKSGNIAKADGKVAARREQNRSVPLPGGATICDIHMTNVDQQNFRYDDNLILTLNKYVMASSTDFTRHFESTNGFYKYDWTRLVGKPSQGLAEHTAPDKQYCAGKSTQSGQCLFPQTETFGQLLLTFDEKIIQGILGITSPNQLNLSLVTTGDDNDSDCKHVPIRLFVEVEYF